MIANGQGGQPKASNMREMVFIFVYIVIMGSFKEKVILIVIDIMFINTYTYDAFRKRLITIITLFIIITVNEYNHCNSYQSCEDNSFYIFTMNFTF